MRNSVFLTLAFLTLTLLPSCEVIGDIFQAGFYTAIFVIIAIVAIIIWIFRSFRGRT